MTNKEALQSILPFEASESFMEKCLLDSGLNGNSVYIVENRRAVELSLAEMIRTKVAEPDFSEEGFSKQINRPALRQLRSDILIKYEMDEGGIFDASSKW